MSPLYLAVCVRRQGSSPAQRYRAPVTPAMRVVGGGDAGSLDSQVFCRPDSMHAWCAEPPPPERFSQVARARMTVAMEVATALHHSAQRWRCQERRQGTLRTAPTGTEDVAPGMRPASLAEPQGPQERIRQHTVEQFGDLAHGADPRCSCTADGWTS